MDREILFRGKRTDNGKWVNGYVTRIKHSDDNGEVESYYFNALDELGWVAECVVSAETVCQYTGLTDKDGRKIFEGDIVETVYDGQQNPNYVVVWDEDELDFKATNGKSHYKNHFEYLGCCDEIIVVGNVFDNPELLEGGVE